MSFQKKFYIECKEGKRMWWKGGREVEEVR